MEEKHFSKGDCANMIGEFLLHLEHSSDFDPFEHMRYPAVRLYYQNKIRNMLLEGEEIEQMMLYINTLKDEEYTYNLFVDYIDNNFNDFINLLASPFNGEMDEACEDLIDIEFSDLSEEEKELLKLHFTTNEDFIRLYPTAYNIMYDAFYAVAPFHNRNKLSAYLPNDVIDVISNYHLKYNKSALPMDWPQYF